MEHLQISRIQKGGPRVRRTLVLYHRTICPVIIIIMKLSKSNIILIINAMTN